MTESAEIQQLRPEFKVPDEPNQLFYVQRSPNANTVVYAAKLDGQGNFDTRNPVEAFWRKFNIDGSKQPLNFMERMMAYGVTLPQVINAISAGNSNVGGRTINMGEQSVNVRGIGVVGSLEDIGNIVLTQQGGVPILLSDVAKVQIGFTPRLGMAGRDDKTDIVTGIVLMQKFERTSDMVKRVHEAIQRINSDSSLTNWHASTDWQRANGGVLSFTTNLTSGPRFLRVEVKP